MQSSSTKYLLTDAALDVVTNDHPILGTVTWGDSWERVLNRQRRARPPIDHEKRVAKQTEIAAWNAAVEARKRAKKGGV